MDRTGMEIIRSACRQVTEYGGTHAGGRDILLALASEPSAVREVLHDLGVTPERIRAASLERARTRTTEFDRPDPAEGDRDGAAGRAVVLGPTAHSALGRAEGFALAWGDGRTEAGHWLLAVLYEGPTAVGGLLLDLGVPAGVIVEEMRRRGMRVPDRAPPVHRPWRGTHHLDVSGEDWKLLAPLLRRRHPPASGLRWGFNEFPGDRSGRCRVSAEEGIDLHELLAEARNDTTVQ